MTQDSGTSAEDPIDSPTPWVAKQISDYVATDGREPDFQDGTPLLLLTVKGRKSGLWKRTALICGEENGSYLVVASMGGAPKHPSWYLNLKANPEVRIQVNEKIMKAIARTATEDEKPALWEKMVGIFGDYADYQKKTERVIPIVILDPVLDTVAG
ncbi:MAG: nitroreductase family deazaflavin-dependent oxidoreductase [Lacisediminihabitans sp.]